MLTLYLRAQPLLLLVLRWLAVRSEKFAELLHSRQGLMERWRRADLGENRIWIHVSSVGELEQVRPVIECLKSRASYSVVMTYFSPSVPKLVRDWSFVRHADYLPFDTLEDMEELVRKIKPRALVLNRYDLWPNHVLAAKRAGIPVVLINASTPPLGWFGWLSLWVRRSLFLAIDAWTFVDAAAAASWEPSLELHARGLVAGNPRVDRALQRAEQRIAEGNARARLELWRKRDFCLVAGSTWPADEDLLLDTWPLLEGNRSLVIVPHESHEAHLVDLERKLARRGLSHVRFSSLGSRPEGEGAEVLIVDQAGYLAEIYGVAQLAYVGGGFGRHVHSVIEPVAHGLLVAFGPRYNRSPEAHTLWAAGAAFVVSGPKKASRLASWITRMRLGGPDQKRAVESLRVFMQVHRGAGERVGQFVETCLRDG